MKRTWLLVPLLSVPCAPAPPPAEAPAGRDAPPSTAPAPAPAPASASAPASAPAPALASASASPLPSSYRVERLLDAHVTFLITGEDGRIAVLADEGGVVTPHRFERGAWQALPLPEAQKVTSADASLGIYFGRDNRPRLMGHRSTGGGRRMVYLRYKDGSWQDQRAEIGQLAGEASQLYGVLGEADPEVVCKLGGICLLKSRKGWKELVNTIPADAVVRVFAGKGYALTSEGVFRAEDAGFSRVGPPASWKSPATGFWVGDDGAVAVAEPFAHAIHRLERGASVWQVDRSPIDGPRDVSGPTSDRWICGDGGLAHGDGVAFERALGAGVHLSRWLDTQAGGLAGGPSGVFAVQKAKR